MNNFITNEIFSDESIQDRETRERKGRGGEKRNNGRGKKKEKKKRVRERIIAFLAFIRLERRFQLTVSRSALLPRIFIFII